MPSQEFEKLKSLLAEDVSDIEAYVKTLQNAGVVFTADYKTEMTSDNKLLLAVHIHAPEEFIRNFFDLDRVQIHKLSMCRIQTELPAKFTKTMIFTT